MKTLLKTLCVKPTMKVGVLVLLLFGGCTLSGEHVEPYYSNTDSMERQIGPRLLDGAHTKNLIRLDFEKHPCGGWRCREVNGELLSLEFVENLDKIVSSKFRERNVASSLNVLMFFPEDFPFLLRQAVIALVFPTYHVMLRVVTKFKEGTLISDLSVANCEFPNDKSPAERACRIKSGYDFFIRKGTFAIRCEEQTREGLELRKSFNVENLAGFLSVVNETQKMESQGASISLTWEWGDVLYFEGFSWENNSSAGEAETAKGNVVECQP